jgi:16S rRNA (cytidine1402-2'-O)-methyltransferase
VRVVPVPGANAAVCALSAAGLPSDRFLFLGFPPRGQEKRQALFSGLRREPGTLILYETGNRLGATLEDLAATLGGRRRAVLARELTKRFETIIDGSLAQLRERLEHDPEQRKGEHVVLVEGARDGEEAEDQDEEDRVLRILAADLPLKQAAALAAEITGGRRNRLYKRALGWRQ